MKQYGVFIRLDIEANSELEALEKTENVLDGINKVEGFKRWEHYEVEEA